MPHTNNPSGSPLRSTNNETRPIRPENTNREPQRRVLHPNSLEFTERRRSTQPIHSHSTGHHVGPRESDKILLEREVPRNRLVKEREEENLNEISFGTRRELETENDNIFADSDTTSQGINLNVIF